MLQKIFFNLGSFFAQLWLGSCLFLSFILAPILFKSFGVEIAADVLSAVFPAYGILLSICSAFCLLAILMLWERKADLGRKTYTAAILATLLALTFSLAQAFYLFPVSKALRLAVKAGRQSGNLESIAGQAESLMRLHKISVGMNNATIIAAFVVAWAFFQITKQMDRTGR